MMDVFDKVEHLKNLIERNVRKFSDDELYKIVEKLGNRWHYPNKRKKGLTLTDDETSVYQLLIDHKINPSTAYKWLLVDRAPADIRFKVRSGVIGIREALKSRKRMQGVGSTTERQFIRMIKDSFERYLIR